MSYITMAILQILFAYLRTLDVLHTVKGNTIIATVVHGALCAVTLVTVFLGVNAIGAEDYLMVVVYIASGMFGKHISMKT